MADSPLAAAMAQRYAPQAAQTLQSPLAQALSPEEQAMQDMSPVDALKFSTQMQNKKVYSPAEASANLAQTGSDLLYASPLGNALSARDALENKWAAQEAAQRGDSELARRLNAQSAASAGMAFLPGMGRIGAGRTADMVAHEADSTLPAIMAWHASPHDFDRFDFSKIGTGEGAQDYGHGGYFAQSPAVSGKGGKYYNQSLESHGKAHAYRTELDVEPHQLLDWDKPVGEQTEAIRKAIAPLAEEAVRKLSESDAYLASKARAMGMPEMKQRGIDPNALTVSDLLKHNPGAEDALREAGVPGIRYLDQGSRGAEGGTHNFVIFDDSLAKILGKE
jgi:hypothetical protein